MSKLIIGEDNWKQFVQQVDDGAFGAGLRPKPYELAVRLKNVRRFTGPTKSRAEIIEGIKYREANNARTTDICDQAGLKIMNQKQTPLCWMFGNVRQVMIAMVRTGQPIIPQSPASLAYKITGGRYRGGYNGEAIEGLAEIGTVPTEFWDDTSFSRSLDTPENDARRTKWALEWVEPETGNLDHLYTLIDEGFTLGLGLNWWGHLVCATDLSLAPNGDILTDIDNSWNDTWGDRGRGSLTPKKSQGDMVALRAIAAR